MDEDRADADRAFAAKELLEQIDRDAHPEETARAVDHAIEVVDDAAVLLADEDCI
jgi:hypothetical protein